MLAGNKRTMKLMIVDDHAGVRELIRQLAVPLAKEVRECTSGAEALRVACEFQPDVVTMDVRLPDLSGIDATVALRGICPGTRVVIVTAYDQPALRAYANAMGALYFIA